MPSPDGNDAARLWPRGLTRHRPPCLSQGFTKYSGFHCAPESTNRLRWIQDLMAKHHAPLASNPYRSADHRDDWPFWSAELRGPTRLARLRNVRGLLLCLSFRLARHVRAPLPCISPMVSQGGAARHALRVLVQLAGRMDVRPMSPREVPHSDGLRGQAHGAPLSMTNKN